MIIVEERLEELFDTLPLITVGGSDYKTAFDFGSHKDLLKFLAMKKKEGGKFYPLIWLETPFTESGKEDRISIDLKLILATLTNAEISNKERLEVTFKPALIPLFENIYKAFRMSGFTKIINPEDNKKTKHYNYGVDGKEERPSNIWDAIKFECELELTECKQEIINY